MMINEPRYCGAERHMRGLACQGRESYDGAGRSYRLKRSARFATREEPMRARRAMLPFVAVLLVTVTAGLGAAEEAPLLPLNVFFANPDASWDYRVSPDGTRLAWIAMNRGRATLHFRRLDETTARIVETPREARAPWPRA